MERVRRLLLLSLVVVCQLTFAQAQPRHKTTRHRAAKLRPCTQGTAFRNCPACGTAKDAARRTLNVQKNRGTAASHPQKITIQEMRDPANDNKFTPSRQVWVTGYVASIAPGGFKETCNCGRADLRDVHINIVADPSEVGDQSKYVVVEFTPRWEKRFGFDDSNYDAMRQSVEDKIKGKWVKFSGWMLRDFSHANASQTTKPDQPTCPDDGQEHSGCNWRATPWEVHPVTSFTVVNGPQ